MLHWLYESLMKGLSANLFKLSCTAGGVQIPDDQSVPHAWSCQSYISQFLALSWWTLVYGQPRLMPVLCDDLTWDHDWHRLWDTSRLWWIPECSYTMIQVEQDAPTTSICESRSTWKDYTRYPRTGPQLQLEEVLLYCNMVFNVIDGIWSVLIMLIRLSSAFNMFKPHRNPCIHDRRQITNV